MLLTYIYGHLQQNKSVVFDLLKGIYPFYAAVISEII